MADSSAQSAQLDAHSCNLLRLGCQLGTGFGYSTTARPAFVQPAALRGHGYAGDPKPAAAALCGSSGMGGSMAPEVSA